MNLEDRYVFGNTSLYRIRNRNELRVIKNLPKILNEHPGTKLDTLDIQDIYALALNKLPAHYVQEGSVVLYEPVDDTMIRDAIREAFHTVMQYPNY